MVSKSKATKKGDAPKVAPQNKYMGDLKHPVMCYLSKEQKARLELACEKEAQGLSAFIRMTLKRAVDTVLGPEE